MQWFMAIEGEKEGKSLSLSAIACSVKCRRGCLGGGGGGSSCPLLSAVAGEIVNSHLRQS